MLQVRSIEQIKYVEDTDLTELGFSRPEQRRLRKYFNRECPQTTMGKLRKRLSRSTGGPRSSSVSCTSTERIDNGKNTVGHSDQHGRSSDFPPIVSEDAEAPEVAQPRVKGGSSRWSISRTRSSRGDQGTVGTRRPVYRVIPSDQLETGTSLGEGEFGRVCQGVWRPESGGVVQVAVKILELHRLQEDLTGFFKEIALMHQLNHPDIVRLYGVCVDCVDSIKVSISSMVDSYLIYSHSCYNGFLKHRPAVDGHLNYYKVELIQLSVVFVCSTFVLDWRILCPVSCKGMLPRLCPERWLTTRDYRPDADTDEIDHEQRDDAVEDHDERVHVFRSSGMRSLGRHLSVRANELVYVLGKRSSRLWKVISHQTGQIGCLPTAILKPYNQDLHNSKDVSANSETAVNNAVISGSGTLLAPKPLLRTSRRETVSRLTKLGTSMGAGGSTHTGSRAARLTGDRISLPQNDFRHIGHVGSDGRIFGDLGFSHNGSKDRSESSAVDADVCEPSADTSSTQNGVSEIAVSPVISKFIAWCLLFFRIMIVNGLRPEVTVNSLCEHYSLHCCAIDC
ncbi:hypothetical protein P879_00277 [Paragonimus westermani]|uniref:non-specific protein-tyrosine kinase n=1 Tax=Paragonimus westermani TaxID=34504 RepID=A0A8T0DVY9_9TREM|nr:hypothetical protein P879_00277 [Paragonimus westermani]